MTYEVLKNIIKWASAIITIVVFLYSLVMFVISTIKRKTKKLTLEDENEELSEKLETSNDLYKLVNEIIPVAMKKAEDTPLIDGATKKLLALSEILLKCNSDGIDFETYKDIISEQIEAFITFSKNINKRKE